MSNEKYSKLKIIFKEVMELKETPKNFTKLKMGNPSAWDSINNLRFLMEIEEEFKIKFDIHEMENLNDIQKIYKKIENID